MQTNLNLFGVFGSLPASPFWPSHIHLPYTCLHLGHLVGAGKDIAPCQKQNLWTMLISSLLVLAMSCASVSTNPSWMIAKGKQGVAGINNHMSKGKWATWHHSDVHDWQMGSPTKGAGGRDRAFISLHQHDGMHRLRVLDYNWWDASSNSCALDLTTNTMGLSPSSFNPQLQLSSGVEVRKILRTACVGRR